MGRVHLEEAPQTLAGVGAPEAVGSQHVQPPGGEAGDLVRHQGHVVGDGHYGALGVGQLAGHRRRLGLVGGIEAVAALHVEGLGPEPLVGGGAPQLRRHVVVLGQHRLGRPGRPHRRAREQHGGPMPAPVGAVVPLV